MADKQRSARPGTGAKRKAADAVVSSDDCDPARCPCDDAACSLSRYVRTTQAAKTSLSGALDIAFKSGTVMGMTVVSLVLCGIAAAN